MFIKILLFFTVYSFSCTAIELVPIEKPGTQRETSSRYSKEDAEKNFVFNGKSDEKTETNKTYIMPTSQKPKKIEISNENFKKQQKQVNKQEYKLNEEKSKAVKTYVKPNQNTIQNTTINETKIVKNTNYTTSNDNNVKLINKIEQNLLYGSSYDKNGRTSNEDIEIKKGVWGNEDLIETKREKKFEIRTSKKVDMTSKDDEKNNRIAKLKDQAFEAVKMKEYEIAIKLYKEVLKLNNKDNFTKLSLATTYHVLGQYVQAKPLYIELLPVFPNSEQLISNLLSIIIQESPYEAIYLLPALAEKHNNSPVIQAQTSVAFSTVDRYDEAIKYIKNAIYLDENNIEYRYNLAVLYDINKNYEKAYKAYKDVDNYIKQNPVASISAKKIEKRIKQLNKYI